MRSALLWLLLCGTAAAQTSPGVTYAAPLRCQSYTTTTTTGGAWSVALTGFRNTPNVQIQALSTGTTATTIDAAYLMAVSASAASGYVYTPITISLGILSIAPAGAGVTVYVLACGS